MKGEEGHGEHEEAFVLSEGGVVQRVNVQGGLIRWKWASEDQTFVAFLHFYMSYLTNIHHTARV